MKSEHREHALWAPTSRWLAAQHQVGDTDAHHQTSDRGVLNQCGEWNVSLKNIAKIARALEAPLRELFPARVAVGLGGL